MPQAVTICDVHKYYGQIHALKGVEFSIEQGEFFGLLGPNGAGKSTLINILAGLTRAHSGCVSVLGCDVITHYREARRFLGIVPQEVVYDPFFTVREMLRIQAGYFGLGRSNEAWREELMAALMLSDKADANMRSLSGGMKRRVLIAQALVHKPEVLVLDEPTAGVDVELRQSLWTFVKRLHKEGHTIVLTTHYLEEAETLCDRIAILNRGKVVALDTKQGLLARANNISLCVTTAQPAFQLPALLQAKIKRQNGNVIELHLHKGTDSIIEVLDALRQTGAEIIDLYTQNADLEDIFIEITRTHSA